MLNSPFKTHLQSEIDHSCKTALLEDLGLLSCGYDLELTSAFKEADSKDSSVKNSGVKKPTFKTVDFKNADITANLIAPTTRAIAKLISRESGILCGQAWVEKVFALLNSIDPLQNCSIKWHIKDGEVVKANDLICEISGNARQLLTGERCAMNFLQSLSATATLTAEYVKTMNSSECKLLDTRKTIPGMRFGQKYAVKIGGGQNHRFGLADAFLIKENHILACGGIDQALASAIKNHPEKLLEIEVENIDELQQAIDGRAQIVMLDNFTNDELVKAVYLVKQSKYQPKLEASGNVNLQTIESIAKTGVDFISVGALTKDIKALDLSMRITLIES